MRILQLLIIFSMLTSCSETKEAGKVYRQVSGIYPHLAYYNNEDECGTGAVVPWADRLWVITYGPHLPLGSSDKLYEITPDLQQIVRPESIGGTPANRMIHRESKQLMIGPYVIGNDRTVNVIQYAEMIGRHTGNARHLKDPANKVYYASMEEGFYEVDVHSLDVHTLYNDKHDVTGKYLNDQEVSNNPEFANLAGAHGKGLYSGQGVLVYSNNGERGEHALQQFDVESGALAEWDGADWSIVRRNQFVEVTGPGGIYGNENPDTDPIWATGWDHRSVLLGVRDASSGWSFYRLPKASHSYDGAHGWNTEWPRIRDVGTPDQPDYLMTMHGLFWSFPENFSAMETKGIRPRSAYLKVIGDFARWQDQLVFGCDDSAKKEFLNKRKQKGGIGGPGQSNSNLWFTDLHLPDRLGPATASGSVWIDDKVKAGETSEPFLFAGWPKRTAWIHNGGAAEVTFTLELDAFGNGGWEEFKIISIPPGNTANIIFEEEEQGEWVRLKSSGPTTATASFNYSMDDNRSTSANSIFDGLAKTNETSAIGGLLYGLGDDRRVLGISSVLFENGASKMNGYYELDEKLELVRKDDASINGFIQDKFAIPKNVVEIDPSSVLVIDDKNRRWRFPLGSEAFNEPTNAAQLRICREVATERDLLNLHGTFYELPAENADGFAKVRPIASHNLRIHDYASYRGMLVMTGLQADVSSGEHVVVSDDGQAAVWLGVIDDLWKLGKPTGSGGPWYGTDVISGQPSDPYLIAFYDDKKLELSHEAQKDVTFRIEVEPIGHGPWMLYKEVTVKAGETWMHEFDGAFSARWIRFVADHDCTATAWLSYQ